MTDYVYASQAAPLEKAWNDVVITAGIDVQTRGYRYEVIVWMADAGDQRLVERGSLSRQGVPPPSWVLPGL